ncbi:hypothetical protein ACFYOF_16660 [Streptomyces sp. NPDC007148]|uniref:hypothetical protein n=1 Tax=Streptomyces sp. NPDC007148 TaxID=3364775 RepID=UPI0036C3966C
MSSRDPEPCDVPADEHTGSVRFYANGWKCNGHSPWAAQGLPEPKPGPGPPASTWTTPGLPSDSHPSAQAAVGHGPGPQPGIRLDPGQQDSRGKWIRIPTADYVCPACGDIESASGDQVARFAQHIETEHHTRCTANPQGAQIT